MKINYPKLDNKILTFSMKFYYLFLDNKDIVKRRKKKKRKKEKEKKKMSLNVRKFMKNGNSSKRHTAIKEQIRKMFSDDLEITITINRKGKKQQNNESKSPNYSPRYNSYSPNFDDLTDEETNSPIYCPSSSPTYDELRNDDSISTIYCPLSSMGYNG